MADAAPAPHGRIKPADADAVIFHALAFLCLEVVRTTEDETACWMLRRALPMVGSSPRMQPIALAAQRVMDAFPKRFQSGAGSAGWCAAMLAARSVMAKDAMAQAMKRVDA